MEHRHYLASLFEPRSVAVIGATERPDAVGHFVMRNLLGHSYQGKVFAINPNRDSIHGLLAHPDIESLPSTPEVAIIATPAHTVAELLRACGRKGVKFAVVYSGGFAEIGAAGLDAQRELDAALRDSGVRILGPNGLGTVRPALGYDCSIGHGQVARGNLALVSQSGTLCNAIIDWAKVNRIGFSNIITLGSSLDVDVGEVLDYLINDSQTAGILIYLEGVSHARRFISALRAASRVKPVIAIKVGRHQSGSSAAFSHTGALVGHDEVFDAILRRTGVTRVQNIPELFAAARTLTSRYRECGERVAIVTNGGGPGALAADRAADLQLTLPALNHRTLERLDQFLPRDWSRANPVDINGDATPERFRDAVAACLEDDEIDSVLVILTPQGMTAPTQVAQALVELADRHAKPILCCWMGGETVREGRLRLMEARIPVFQYPETLVGGYHCLLTHRKNQQLLLQMPAPTPDRAPPDLERARALIAEVRADGRSALNQQEAMALLAAFHIPVPQAGIVQRVDAAIELAEKIGYPVAMKIHSPDIDHKSEVGGIALNLRTAAELVASYWQMMRDIPKRLPDARLDGVLITAMATRPRARELLVGVTTDPIFGPVISLGTGGIWVEAYDHHAVALPPLNEELALDLIRNVRFSHLLGAHRRFPAISQSALATVLIRVSELVEEFPEIAELDINPLLVDEQGTIAVDARVYLREPAIQCDPYDHLAICPYPKHLIRTWQLRDGTQVTVRPIRPKDAEMEQNFVRNLSDRSRYLRFWSGLSELNRRMLAEFTKIDYGTRMSLIVTLEQDGQEIEIAVAQFSTTATGQSCEFAIVVADGWQGQGLGGKLMAYLIEIARCRGYRSIEGEVLSENRDMLNLMRALGFKVEIDPEDLSVRRVVKNLLEPDPPRRGPASA
ncbi:MAG TPA: GNAT family N-acetyltransferase [Pseudomonadales bacterium]|nr:GNAT family N-acetyltransferase [Pseudomonadales bacterium]